MLSVLLPLLLTLCPVHCRPSPPPPNRLPASLVGAPELPQCTDNLVLGSEMHTERSASGEDPQHVNISSFVQLTTVGLGETFCMLITSNNSHQRTDGGDSSNSLGREGGLDDGAASFAILHTIEYVRLELHYAITGAYKFALPAISSRCKCDCAGGEQICSVEKYQYRNCSTGAAVCYRTYRSGQSNVGCPTSGKTEVCCQVEINPFRDWSFQAIRLKQPSTLLVLRYRIFERSQFSARKWTMSADKRIAIPLNKGATKFELNEQSSGAEKEAETGSHRVEISAAGGRPHRQLEPGMYFYRIVGGSEMDANAGDRLRDGVALNAPGESSLEKLGWLRWERGHGWTVRKGLEKVTQAQHISVEDCKAQRYRATFNAEQFVLRGNGGGEERTAVERTEEPGSGETAEEEIQNFDLGTLVRDEPWAGAVRVGEREVVLEHAEGIALALTIRTESRPQIVHHSSQFSNFSGTIVLDKESNRYLNLTFHNARGTLIGQIFSSADSLSVMESIFSIDVGKFTVEKFQRVVATAVQSPKLVCFYPVGNMVDGRVCHRLEFVREPMQETHFVADQWQQGHSECIGCNERGVDSFLASIDPRQWLDGLNTPAELFTCLIEVALCTALLLVSILLLTKCVVPLCRCVCFALRPSKQ